MIINKKLKMILLDAIDKSIIYGLEKQQIMPIKLENYPEELLKQRSCFVTLKINNRLRGCMGTLIAKQPLIENVIHNAYAAAFKDNRFRTLQISEFNMLTKELSILSTMQEMQFDSQEALISKIRPGTDGLLLIDGKYSGTFLPSMWEQLPQKQDFLKNLKVKAGLDANHWSNTVKIYRYTAQIIN